MHRSILRVVSAVILACLACTVDGARLVGPDEWEVLFQIRGQSIATVAASPDGALFVATSEGVYRHIPGVGPTFERIMPAPNDFPQVLAAPSRSVVYHLTRGLDAGVMHWREGIGATRVVLPPLEPWMTCGDDCLLWGLPLSALWARSNDEVWASGDYGIVVRITGDTGRLERTPMLEFAHEAIGSSAIYRADLRYIAGDPKVLFLGSASALLRYQGGIWDTLPNPWRRSPGCAAYAMVIQHNTLLFGGHVPFPGPETPCVIAITGERAERLDDELRGFGEPGIFGGALQSDGSALFHASAYGRSEIALLRGGRGQVLAFPELFGFGGAAVIGGYVYVGGQLGESAAVIRAPLGWRYAVRGN